MSKKKHKKADGASQKSQAFNYLSKGDFLAAINGDDTASLQSRSSQSQKKTTGQQNVAKPRLSSESHSGGGLRKRDGFRKESKDARGQSARSLTAGSLRSTTDFNSSDSYEDPKSRSIPKAQKRKREGNGSQVYGPLKRQRIQGQSSHTEVTPSPTQDSWPGKPISGRTVPRPEATKESRVDPSPNPFSHEAIRMRFSVAKETSHAPVLQASQPEQSFANIVPVEENTFRSLAPGTFTENDNGRQGRSRESSGRIPFSIQSTRRRTPVTPCRSGSESGSEGSQRGGLFGLGTQTPSTPGRSPYINRLERPKSASAVPHNHVERLEFPGRAERTRMERPIEEITAKGGLFTPSEKNRLFAYCADFQQVNNLNDQEFATMVHQPIAESSLTREFYSRVLDPVPYREKWAVRRFLERQFHNFGTQTGWSKSDDERLAAAVSRIGRKWRKVGAEVGRHQEHCRDRYRNYHFTKDQKLSKWEEDESGLLCRAVGDNILTVLKEQVTDIKAHATAFNPRTGLPSWTVTEKDASTMVLWSTIATSVPRRSRLQCYMRYGVLRKNGETSYVLELKRAMKRAGSDNFVVDGVHVLAQGAPADHLEGIRLSFRHRGRSTQCKIKELYDGDKLELLQAIRDSDVKRDEDIDWDRIRTQNESLQKFGEGLMVPAWESMKSKYETAKGKSLQGVKTRKAAKKVLKLMERTISKADRLRRWGDQNGDQIGKLRGPCGLKIKSPYFVDEEDREETNDAETRDFTLGDLKTGNFSDIVHGHKS